MTRRMRKIVEVQVLSGYRLNVRFDDGVSGTIDLSDLVGKGVFGLWKDRRFFAQVRIGTGGELAWGDRVDLCPDATYLRVTGKTPEEVFPGLDPGSSHA